jgi:plasmid stability protein
MPVNLSIKNAPDEIVDKLRKRAQRNHRSLQGELMAILEDAVGSPKRQLTIRELAAEVDALGLKTPSEAVQMIREDRDGR